MIVFPKKYKEVIDTRDIVFSDDFSEMEKSGAITPLTLTQKNINYIQVRTYLNNVLVFWRVGRGGGQFYKWEISRAGEPANWFPAPDPHCFSRGSGS